MTHKKKYKKSSGKQVSNLKNNSDSLKKSYIIRLRAVLLYILVIAGFLVYSNALQGPFMFDDGNNIVVNPHIRLIKLSLDGLERAAFKSVHSHRPVANISFALNYYFHQYHVVGYHIVNVLIHIITGMLLFVFIQITLSLPGVNADKSSSLWISFFTALLWLVHPIQTQSVAYIVQRMNSMAAMFYVLSFLFYVKARLAEKKRWALFAGCVLAGLLAMGCKEIAVTLPFFILLYEWYFFQDLSKLWLKRNAIYLIVLGIILISIVFIYMGPNPVERILSTYVNRDFTLTQRLLTEFRVVIHYLSLLFYPHPSRLNLDYDFPLSTSLIHPVSTLLCLCLIIFLIGFAIYSAKKERLISFGILWFFGNLVIESSVIGLEIIFEHRTYLPSIFVSLIIVMLTYRYVKLKWFKPALLCAIALVCSVWTYERNKVWSDHVVLWRDCVAKSPQKARPHNNLGMALAHEEKFDEAILSYKKAFSIKPNYAEAYNNIGVALSSIGKVDNSIIFYNKALKIKPDYSQAYNNLGLALSSLGKANEAISYFLKSLQIDPAFIPAYNNLGKELRGQGKVDEAILYYRNALRIAPNSVKVHNNIGVALAIKGQLNEAIEHFRNALQINPDAKDAHQNLQKALNLKLKK
ncbi:protein O-mannosyl-transferase [Candidatus Magnetomoraceae bacterium gMMP-15]